jgi:hypothetical protein
MFFTPMSSIVSDKNNAVLTLTIMTRGCESKQADSNCQSYKQNRIIFGNDYAAMSFLPTVMHITNCNYFTQYR